jgi:hypothetical protein
MPRDIFQWFLRFGAFTATKFNGSSPCRQSLMMKEETVSETLNIYLILPWLIAREDIITKN